MATLEELYPGRWASLLIPLRGKVATGTRWQAQAIKRYESGEVIDRVSLRIGNVGLVVPPGLLVLDCDTREVTQWLAEALPDSEEYPWQESRPGRCHVWVQLLNPYLVDRQAPSHLPCGKLDLRRGGHGYVVVAPSIHPDTGEPYRWIVPLPADPDDVPFLPDELLKVILDGQVSKPVTMRLRDGTEWSGYRATLETNPAKPTPTLDESCQQILSTNLRELTQTRISEGDRNDYLYRRACAIVANAHPESFAELLAALMVRNTEDCDPLLGLIEVEAIARSAYQHRAPPVVDPETGERQLLGTLMSDVEPTPIDWLWRYHLAVGALTLIDGKGGIGKSLVVADWIARVTTGGIWPDGSPGGDPGGVVLCSGEDDIGNTVAPRLIEAGVDRTLVRDLRFPQLTTLGDIDVIRANVESLQARLVVFDPVTDYLGDADMNRDNEIRGAFRAMLTLAREMGFAVLCLRHVSKGATSGTADNAGLGSVAMTNLARVQFLATPRPDEPGASWLSMSKANLCPPEMLQKSLPFRTVHSGALDGSLSIEWGEYEALSADDCLQAAAKALKEKQAAERAAEREEAGLPSLGRPPKASVLCMEWLIEILEPGPMRLSQVHRLREGRDFSEFIFRSAKHRLGAESYQSDGEDSQWMIRLPESAP